MPSLSAEEEVASEILLGTTEPEPKRNNAIGHCQGDTSCQTTTHRREYRNYRSSVALSQGFCKARAQIVSLSISTVLLLVALVPIEALGVTRLPSEMFPSTYATNLCTRRVSTGGPSPSSFRGLSAFSRSRLERAASPHLRRSGTACGVSKAFDISTYLNSLTKSTGNAVAGGIANIHTLSTKGANILKTNHCQNHGHTHPSSSTSELSNYGILQTEHQQMMMHTSNLTSTEYSYVNQVESDIALTTVCASDQYETVFSIDMPEGRCVGVRLSNPNQAPSVPTSIVPSQIESNPQHWLRHILHEEEVGYGVKLRSDPARMSFYMGRIAMRTALAQINEEEECPLDMEHSNGMKIDSVEFEDDLGGFTKLPLVSTMDPSILKDEHGRPQVPHGFIGSISHKKDHGVALVSTIPADMQWQVQKNMKGSGGTVTPTPTLGIGVDIEQTFSRRKNIAKKILTPNEMNDLGGLKGVTQDEEVLLRFSLKESVYKAMHPMICQFVGFQEAEIKPHEDGTATVFLNLKSGKHERFKEVQAHWRRLGGEYFLTSSKVILKDSNSDGGGGDDDKNATCYMGES